MITLKDIEFEEKQHEAEVYGMKIEYQFGAWVNKLKELVKNNPDQFEWDLTDGDLFTKILVAIKEDLENEI